MDSVHNQTMDSELFENQTIAYQFILTACKTIVNVITAFLYALKFCKNKISIILGLFIIKWSQDKKIPNWTP